MILYVYPYKCHCCQTTGKYYTGISPVEALDFHCPHDGSALTFQVPVQQRVYKYTEVPKTVDDEIIEALVTLTRL